MKILFWIINYPNSVGEITNVVMFAKELTKNSEIKVYFYSSNILTENYLRSYKFDSITKDEIIGQNFDLLIISEYYTLFNIKAGIKEKEVLDFIKTNYFGKIPLISFDTLGIGSSNNEIKSNMMKVYSFGQNYKNVEIYNEELFFTIRPCPISYPEQSKVSDNSFYWAMPELEKDPDIEKKVIKMFGISQENIQIFLPISKWLYFQWVRELKNGKKFYFDLANFFIFMLESLKINLNCSFFFGTPNNKYNIYKNNGLDFYIFDPEEESYIDPQLFDQFLARTGIILNIHLLQNSFTRAITSGIPGINLTNGVTKTEQNIPSDFFLNEVKINDFYTPGKYPFDNHYIKNFQTFEIIDNNLLIHLIDLITTKFKNEFFVPYKNILKTCLKADEIISKIKKDNSKSKLIELFYTT